MKGKEGLNLNKNREVAMKGFNENRKFGVEIEFLHNVGREAIINELARIGIECTSEGYNHITREHWKIVQDGSVHGNTTFSDELVSPPLKGKEGLEELKKVMEVMNRIGAVNKTCSIHVHHDIHDYNGNDLFRAVWLYTAYEETIDTLFPESRRADNNYYCGSLKTKMNVHRFRNYYEQHKNKQTLNKFEVNNLFNYDRYVKLNLKSIVDHGTLEFRQHAGSLEFEKIYNWILLSQRIVEICKTPIHVRGGVEDNWNNLKYQLKMYKSFGADNETQAMAKWWNRRRIDLDKSLETRGRRRGA